MPSCSHEARNVQGVIQQGASGDWHATFYSGGLVLRSVKYCPFCGERLHGKPRQPVQEQHSSGHAKKVQHG